MTKIASVIVLLLLGCAPKHVNSYPGPIVKGSCYEYRPEAKNLWLVWGENEKCIELAKKEIGCGICTEEPYGFIHVIELIEDKKK